MAMEENWNSAFIKEERRGRLAKAKRKSFVSFLNFWLMVSSYYPYMNRELTNRCLGAYEHWLIWEI